MSAAESLKKRIDTFNGEFVAHLRENLPDLSDDSVHNRLVLRTIFVHMSKALAPHVPANGESMQNHLLVISVVREEVHHIFSDLLQIEQNIICEFIRRKITKNRLPGFLSQATTTARARFAGQRRRSLDPCKVLHTSKGASASIAARKKSDIEVCHPRLASD